MLKSTSTIFVTLALISVAARGNPVDGSAIANTYQGGNWLSYGRTYSEQRYSPLAQINDKNIDQLKLDWYVDLPVATSLTSTPLVVDGIMYFSSSQSVVMAVDGRSGELIWRYDPEVLAELADSRAMRLNWGANRGVAFWKNKVFVGTYDGRLVALDAGSGHVVWQTRMWPSGEPRYSTGAPRVFNNLVLLGHGGAEAGAVRGYVSAYSTETGKEVWRTYIVPGNPKDGFESAAMEMAAKTWNGQWWIHGGGGTVWNSMTYDPELNRVYLGTGNGAPWNRDIRSPGGGDNLFLCSILALDADTGKYLWHYQINPGESWDYNAAMDIVMAKINWKNEERDVLLHAPKNGFFYVLDRLTGKLLGAEKLGKVTWAERIDIESGRPVETEIARFPEKHGVLYPGIVGAHNWHPMSFNPETGLVYIPYQETAMYYDWRGIDGEKWRADEFAMNTGYHPYRDDIPVDGASGALIAWNPSLEKIAWRVERPGFWNGGTLTSAGNLVWQGTGDGKFAAYRAASGEALWEFHAGIGISAPPITYSVNGKQYVSVLAGWGGAGYVGSSHLAQHGWKYRSQRRRLLTFSLTGSAEPPVQVAASNKVEVVRNQGEEVDAIAAHRGKDIYLEKCFACHGFAVISSGGAPDLRASQISANKQVFSNLLRNGNFQARGMPRFQELTDQEISQIYWYIRQRAEQDAQHP